MADASLRPSFPTLLQHFFVDHLHQQRAVSPNTIAAYRDTFKLLLLYAGKAIGKSPTCLSLRDLDATLILGFLDHLERNRSNSVSSRNARLSAIRSFLKYAAHHDLSTLVTIEHGLAIPSKRHDKAVLGFLTKPEMEAIIAAPDQRSWVGGGIVCCSHCSTTPAHEYRRPSIYGSATSSWTYRLWHISMGKDGRGGAFRSGKRQQALFDNGSASSPGPKIPTSCFQIARAGSCHARA